MIRVFIYGGPGTGKSTTAAHAFALLKQRGLNVELVREYAKDLTWEHRHDALAFQPYIAAKELWHVERLAGQVDAVISDSSPLLSIVYGGSALNPKFKDYLVDDHESKATLDVFLRRDPRREYVQAGRSQTREEAVEVDGRILQMLERHAPFYQIVDMGPGAAEEIAALVTVAVGASR